MGKNRILMLVDNGSTRADATLNLRRLAAALGQRVGQTVYPVSLQHAEKIPAAALGGQTADVFIPFLRQQRAQGAESFIVTPLFFGNSRALTRFIPDGTNEVRVETGDFQLRVAEPLCPMPEGEPGLARILCENAGDAAKAAGHALQQLVLVDHGSPIPEVTAVRQRLAQQMREILGTGIDLQEAVMERRPGPEYDFNGPLLEDLLNRMAGEKPRQRVVLAMLFFSPGRHAGPGGDIEEICERVVTAHPGFQVTASPLIGDHPGLVDILETRLRDYL